MSDVSEAVERVREDLNLFFPEDNIFGNDLRAILIDEIARLTEQVRVAREAMLDADRRLSRPDWTVQRDTVRTKLRETLTRMEKNDGQ
ncbi:MAG: hypothetical protein ACK5QX_03640 [bacterium]